LQIVRDEGEVGSVEVGDEGEAEHHGEDAEL